MNEEQLLGAVALLAMVAYLLPGTVAMPRRLGRALHLFAIASSLVAIAFAAALFAWRLD